MRLREFTTLNEMPWGGSHGFPGKGLKIFTQKYYAFIAHKLGFIGDDAIKEYLTNWFIEIFSVDNPDFKAELFKKTVDTLKSPRLLSNVTFQQRHFYFLAKYVSEIPDENAKEFVCDWLGDMFADNNSDFRPARWKKFCGVPITPEEEKVVNAPRERRRRY